MEVTALKVALGRQTRSSVLDKEAPEQLSSFPSFRSPRAQHTNRVIVALAQSSIVASAGKCRTSALAALAFGSSFLLPFFPCATCCEPGHELQSNELMAPFSDKPQGPESYHIYIYISYICIIWTFIGPQHNPGLAISELSRSVPELPVYH